MFALKEPKRPSPLRLIASALLHTAALFLAVNLRFAAPNTPAAARPTPVTLALRQPTLPPVHPTRRVSAMPASRTERRAFIAPAAPAAPRPAAVHIESALVTPEPALSIAIEPSIAAALEPPPVIVGKLTTATAAVEIAPTRSLHPTAFANRAQAEAPSTKVARVGGFGESSVAAPSARKSTPDRDTTPVEILSKPRPLYTEEARRLRLEGEVLLEVLFPATGSAQVQRILQGLGHGLDEAAAASAAKIQFRPALRAGQPVDQAATVRIVFLLAY